MEKRFSGIGVSRGIAVGKAFVFKKSKVVVSSDLIGEDDVEEEYGKFLRAVEQSRAQMTKVMERAKGALGESEASLLKAQIGMLDDPVLVESVALKIKKERKNALLALDETLSEIESMFAMIDDEFYRERIADVKDICGRIANNLAGVHMEDLSDLPESVVVIANDLLPSDIAMMDIGKVAGFVTDQGGSTSHTAIMAKSIGIPAVVGTKQAMDFIKSGSMVVMEGEEGLVIVNPGKETVEQYVSKREKLIEREKLLARLKELPAQTTDGKTVKLFANIGSVKEIADAVKNGAEGIGLFRTEFLYMNGSHFPTEDEQFNVYKEAALKMRNMPVVIRTLDIGGDKELPYFRFAAEQNPFLGWRAIRMCLDEKDIFKTQLRAIIRASAYGEIRVMFPMIISLEEFLQAKGILLQCMKELKSEGVEYNPSIEVGMMVETPAAVMLSEVFAREADFFSIGTNDLTQYMLAVDRGNEKIAQLYNPFHPAVISGIKKVVDAAHRAGKWVGLCGELACDEKAALLLLGLGLDEFSMSAASIPFVKDVIRKADYKTVKNMAEQAVLQKTADGVIKIVTEAYERLMI